METHANHLHNAPGKNFWHYFFEFFMLFLAVFCGFLAENYREHRVEQTKEKEYIESMIADLKSDQLILSDHISEVKGSIEMMDSMITLLDNPSLLSNNTGSLYYFARLSPRLMPLAINDKTFEQLKSSGNFRLIKNINTSNKITDYYKKLLLIRLLESINETEFTQYKIIAAKIFDPEIFLKAEGIVNEIRRIDGNPPLRVTDKEILKELSIFTVYLHGTRKGILGADEDTKKAGAELIGYLEKEYHHQ